MQLRRAQKSVAKLRIGLAGPSGAGKTYSALLLASGMAAWDKIAVIDTENMSADLYSDLGQYNVLTLTPPFSPERFIDAIHECETAGMDVIIIDSVTHEWDGDGGCLQINERAAGSKFKGNTWAAWSETTPRHQKFIDAITACKAHVIACNRSKTETMQTDDKKIKKVGTKDIQREGFEYELTVKFDIDRDKHYAVASKDRTGMFIDADPFIINKETGEQLLKWANTGVDPNELAEEIAALMIKKGVSLENTLGYYKVNYLAELPLPMLYALKERLESMPDEKDKPKPPVIHPPEPVEPPKPVESVNVDEIDAALTSQKAQEPINLIGADDSVWDAPECAEYRTEYAKIGKTLEYLKDPTNKLSGWYIDNFGPMSWPDVQKNAKLNHVVADNSDPIMDATKNMEIVEPEPEPLPPVNDDKGAPAEMSNEPVNPVAPPPPMPAGDEMASVGDIKLLEALIQRRAKQAKKGYEVMRDALLKKLFINTYEELTKNQAKRLIDIVSKLNTENDDKNREAEETAKNCEEILGGKEV